MARTQHHIHGTSVAVVKIRMRETLQIHCGEIGIIHKQLAINLAIFYTILICQVAMLSGLFYLH